MAIGAVAGAAATVAWAKLRLPATWLVRGHVGDGFAAMFVFAGLGFVLGRRVRTRWRALAALAIAFGMELGQLVWSAHSTAGELVLGNEFDPWDLLAYVVGVAAAAAIEASSSRAGNSARHHGDGPSTRVGSNA